MSASDFVRGAIGGYDFVDTKFREKEQDSQRRMAIQTDEQRYQEQQKRQRAIDDENRETNQFNREQTLRSSAIAEENLALNRSNQEFNQNRLTQADERTQRQQERERLREEAVATAQRAMAGGDPFPREMHERLRQNGMSYLSFYDGIERPDVHQAALSLEPVLRELGTGNVAVVNTPPALESINTLYADQLKRGIGEYNVDRKGIVVSKRIHHLEPSPVRGKFAAVVEVTLDTGEKYLAPRTRDASTAETDPVMLIDVGKAMDDLQGHYQLARIRDQNKENIQAQYRAIYGVLPGEEDRVEYEFQETGGGTDPITGEKIASTAGRFDSRSGTFEPFENFNGSSPQSGSLFDQLPNPASYSGRTVLDEETGVKYRSNGSEWEEVSQ